jgi:uncharacterized protein (DUF305 family)
VRTTAIRGTAAAVLLSAAVLGLAGCVNAEQSAPPGAGQNQSYGPAPTTVAPTSAGSASGSVVPQQAGTDHNAADVSFVDQAVALRQQAASLATKATTASTDSRIQSLATAIVADVVPSVDTLIGWLTQWGAPSSVPGQVPGLLSDAQVQQLESATGTPFDMQWLQAMQGNLQAAQTAATTEVSKGTNAAAKQLAQQWVTELKSELAKLKAITG